MKIVQFHVLKDHRARLDEVCAGRPIYLGAELEPTDPAPSAWVQVSLTDPKRLPQYYPYQRWFIGGHQYLSVNSPRNLLEKSPELVRLESDRREIDRHTYYVVSNPWLSRNSTLDVCRQPAISVGVLLPGGSTCEMTEESQRTFRVLGRVESSVVIDAKTAGWLAKWIGVQVDVKTTDKYSRDTEAQQKDTSAKKLVVHVPEQQTGYRAEVTFRFDLGFRRHWTTDGFQWNHEDLAVPVEVVQSHCSYLPETRDTSACRSAFERDVNDNLLPTVKEWVQNKLQRQMSDSEA
jgi:hypothetical protein